MINAGTSIVDVPVLATESGSGFDIVNTVADSEFRIRQKINLNPGYTDLIMNGNSPGGVIIETDHTVMTIGMAGITAHNLDFGSVNDFSIIATNGVVGENEDGANIQVTPGGGVGAGEDGKFIVNGAISIQNDADGNVYSSTYTPTITNGVNVASSTAHVFHFMRVGDMVTFGGIVEIDPISGSDTFTEIGISLPVLSDLALTGDASGTGVGVDGPGTQACEISADALNDRIRVNFLAITASNMAISFQGSYLIK